MAKSRFSPLRDSVFADAEQFRVYFNGILDDIYGALGNRTALVKLRDVVSGSVAKLSTPPFKVGALTIGALQREDGATTFATAPIAAWVYQPDGSIQVTFQNMPAVGKWACTLLLVEDI